MCPLFLTVKTLFLKKLIHMILREFFRQPYNYYYVKEDLFKITLFVFAFFFLFTFLFEPFNINRDEHRISFFFICTIHGLISSLSFWIFFYLMNIFENEENWTVGKEMLSYIFLFLFIGVFNFLIRPMIYDNPQNSSVYYFFEELLHIILVGILLVLTFIPVNFFVLYHQNSRKAEGLPPSFEHRSDSAAIISIDTETLIDNFDLNMNSFLFAKADGNYIEFNLEKPDLTLKKEVKRISLKELEKQLSIYGWIFKTHRSYLVNLKKIKKVSGNAQGYSLKLGTSEISVPVSRGNLVKFNEAYGHTKNQ